MSHKKTRPAFEDIKGERAKEIFRAMMREPGLTKEKMALLRKTIEEMDGKWLDMQWPDAPSPKHES